MLEQLVETIETLRARLLAHGSHIGAYEARTRTALIDPLLQALGWDVSDPLLVHIEPKGLNGWADYALLGSNGRTIVAFIEAKKLTDTRTPLSQVVGYAVSENIENNTNVRYVLTTNGNNWDVYDIVTQNAVTTTSIQSEEPEAVAFKLMSLWRRSFADGRLNTIVEPLFSKDDLDPQTVPPPPPSPPPPVSPKGLEWRNIPQPSDAKNTSGPQTIRFSDGQEEDSQRSWRPLLVATARWLHKAGHLTPDKLPVVSSEYSENTYYLVSKDGRHSNGGAFRKSVVIAEGVILDYSEFDAATALRRIYKLLKHCKIDADSIQLGFRTEGLI